MLARLNAGDFRNGLNKILSVVDKKNTRPILAYTLINVTKHGIELLSTDLEISAKVFVPAEVENTGSFCVNGRNLFDILRELPESPVFLKINEKESLLHLTCNEIHYELMFIKSDDFPQLVFKGGKASFNLQANQLLSIINRTSHAISTDETRIFLNGIYLQELDSKLRSVATDGYHLVLVETEFDRSKNESLVNGVIIPKKGIFEIKKMAEDGVNQKIEFSLDDNFLYATLGNEYQLSMRLIARDYPKYQAVIPNKTTYSLTVDRALFLNAVKRIKIMSNEKSNGVKIAINQNEIVMRANHPTLGMAEEKIKSNYTGKSMEIGFNAKYLIDTFSTIHDGDVTIEFNNEVSPIVVKSPNDPGYLAIIMPLKL